MAEGKPAVAVEVLIPIHPSGERLSRLGAPVHFEKEKVLKAIAVRCVLMKAHKSVRLDEDTGGVVGTGQGRLCCLKLVEKRPGGKLDKLVVRYISDGTRELGLDIEHCNLVPQGKLAYLGSVFKLIPYEAGII